MEYMKKEARLTIIAFILMVNVGAILCQATYQVRIPSKFCKHCQGFSDIRTDESSGCPLLRNDTFEIVNQLGPLLGQIKDTLIAEKDLLGSFLTSDTDFEPYDIIDLQDIEKSSISKYLRAGTKVEKIIHHGYGRMMMQIAYLNLYIEILERHRHLNEKLKGDTQVNKIIQLSEAVSCKLYDYTSMLGIRKIKKMCKFIDVKPFTGERDEKEYIQSIVQHSVKSFEATIDAIEDLNSPEITENCQYECGAKMEIFLRCSEDKKQFRNAPKGRKNRKDRKNKNKTRRRKNKGRKGCKKNKGEEKSNKRRCKNRRRNKKRSQKRKNICFRCT